MKNPPEGAAGEAKVVPTKEDSTIAEKRAPLPDWAEELSEIYLSGASSVFVLHGNIYDLVAVPARDGKTAGFRSVEDFLTSQLFGQRDIVIRYDRGSGLTFLDRDRPERGREMRQDFDRTLQAIDMVQGTDFSKSRPKDPRVVLELLDRYILHKLAAITGRPDQKRKSVAILVRYAEVIAPAVDAAWLSGEVGSNIIKLLNWANDPGIRQADVTVCLLCENLAELNPRLVENPFVSKIQVPLPEEKERLDLVEQVLAKESRADLGMSEQAKMVARVSNGLTLVGVSQIIRRGIQSGRPFDASYLREAKKDLIEKECYGLLEFIEPRYNLSMVVAQQAVRHRLEEDARLIREGHTASVPMGYLLCGMLGTGKTFTSTCFAGSIGIPAVVFKDIREKWVGSSERNMQKVLTVVRALGPVMVIVDEADAALGKRTADGDSGTSSRLFAMVAAQMADTEYRGKIIWVLLTARPDLLTVDLKRQGRCEVHIPLFPPQTPEERLEMFQAMARKNKVTIDPASIPALPEHLSGADLESLLVQSMRMAAVRGLPSPTAEVIREVVSRFVSPNYSLEKELQELVAIRECTDLEFLPERYRPFLTDPQKAVAMEQRIQELQALLS